MTYQENGIIVLPLSNLAAKFIDRFFGRFFVCPETENMYDNIKRRPLCFDIPYMILASVLWWEVEYISEKTYASVNIPSICSDDYVTLDISVTRQV